MDRPALPCQPQGSEARSQRSGIGTCVVKCGKVLDGIVAVVMVLLKEQGQPRAEKTPSHVDGDHENHQDPEAPNSSHLPEPRKLAFEPSGPAETRTLAHVLWPGHNQ